MTSTGLLRGKAAKKAAAKLPVVPAAKKTHSVLVWLSYGWMAAIILLAVFAPVLHLPSYATPIGFPRLGPSTDSLSMLLGTDGTGRSMLSRLIYGARVSLVVGTAACVTTFVLGSLLGMMAGYFGKKLDTGIGLLTDVMLAFPGLVLLLALAATFTPSITTLIVGMGVMGMPQFVRLARAQTLSWSTRGFVRAAKNMGAGPWRILFREILPNVLPPLAAYLPIVLAHVIVAEGSLSFLGLGIPPPSPSWGGMIYAGKDSIADDPHLVFVPALAIFCTVFALNQIGDHLRNRFDGDHL
ncbi:ABC transporter permease [Amycolatopsis acidicola]|uniref:ABC transporter permease n=1 Tax=Amycolatopsis acidicola TaxID=2596893 RepID=A0A5N0UZ64_9PSEU|nr:ABC transporter permease [Amycolatopsis acidicola]KAA9159076.1 ABC transporter permease [Amycolatopsis acidicola]